MIQALKSLKGDPTDELDSLKGWIVVGCVFVSMIICFGVVYSSFDAFLRPIRTLCQQFGIDVECDEGNRLPAGYRRAWV